MHQFQRRRSRLVALAAAGILAVPINGVPQPASAADPPPLPAQTSAALRKLADGRAQTHEITLITGDKLRVTIAADGRPDIRTEIASRPDGRPVLMQALVDEDNLYVLPSDVTPSVAAGKLDRRLFDIRRLIADGYTDASSATLPVIVSYSGKRADLRSAAARTSTENSLRSRAEALPASRPVRVLESVNGAALAVTKREASTFWSTVQPARGTFGTGIDRVWLDGRARVTLDESVPLTGAPQAWAAGFDGTGVKVAVLDTGVDATHPDLAGRVVDSRSFIPGETVADGHGHGTHVAATIAGVGSPYKGVAPGADLLVGKVLADNGFGPDSGIIDGMEWAAASGATVVSMSLGGEPTDGTDPMSQAVNTLTASTGALFVIAAANAGGERTVATPGAADAALTVAAVNKAGVRADFSSRGPRIGDHALKPEIAAPGVSILAAKPGGGHQVMSGTSMATPHVAGAAAILAQRRPDWTAAQLKAALIGTTRDDSHTVYETGAGQLDVHAAIQATVVPVTEKVDFAKLPYPQTGPAVTRTVTFRNTGTGPVTLALSGSLSDQNKADAPAGMLSVSPASVNVPAGGTADVTVTLDPTLGPAGLYSGQVLATAAGVTVRVPVGAYKEPRGFDLTVTMPDRADHPVTVKGTLLIRRIDRDSGNWIMAAPAATTTVRLDEGVYTVTSLVQFGDDVSELENVVMMSAPQVDLRDDNAAISLDVNRAVPITVTADRPTAQYGSTTNIWHRAADVETGFGEVLPQLPYVVRPWAIPTGKVTVGDYFFDHTHLLGTPVVTARVPELGNRTLHPRYQHYSAGIRKLPEGKGSLPIVDVGRGAEADFARVDVRGRIALVNVGRQGLGPNPGGFARAEIRRAAEAGAAALLGYGDSGTPNVGYYQTVPDIYPLPVLGVPAEEGRALRDLLSRGRKATLAYDSQPALPHVYVLSYFDQGGVPAELDYRVRDRDLAEVRVRQQADRPVAQYKHWLPWRPKLLNMDDYGKSFATVTLDEIAGPVSRTEHIGPVSDSVTWFRGMASFDLDRWLANAPVRLAVDVYGIQYAEGVFDVPGRRSETWGLLPSVPGALSFDPKYTALVDTALLPCAACRGSGVFPADILPVFLLSTDTQGHYTELTSYANTPDHALGQTIDETRLYVNGEELPQQSLVGEPGVLPFYLLPDGPAEYRLTQRFESPTFRNAYGRKIDSAWTFSSQSPTVRETPDGHISLGLCADKCRVEPLIFLRYHLNLGLDNHLPAGSVHTFTVEPYRQTSTVAQPKVAGLRMSASYDGGQTWVALPTTRLPDGSFQVRAVHPGDRSPASTVSLRAQAWDVAGNRIEQTVFDAYGLTTRR